MKNIDRYIYIWDIHGSWKLNNVIDEYNNWRTFFYFLGDLFDRWEFSYQNFKKIQELHKLWLANVVIWNHDIFFLMSKWLKYNTIIKQKILEKSTMAEYNYIKQYYDELYLFNGWEQTDNSFKKALHKDLDYEEYNEKLEELYIEVVNYLFSNFDTYIIDHNNNLLVHWWIPILPTGELVTINIDNELYSWVELIKKINQKFKLLETEWFEILESWIDWYNKAENILSLMLRLWLLKKSESIYNYWQSMYLSHIWYNSSLYDKSEIVRNTLIKELNEQWLNNIFLWHWWNKEAIDSDYWNYKSKYWEYNRVFRIDKSYNYWDLWYAIFNEKNELLKTWVF